VLLALGTPKKSLLKSRDTTTAKLFHLCSISLPLAIKLIQPFTQPAGVLENYEASKAKTRGFDCILPFHMASTS